MNPNTYDLKNSTLLSTQTFDSIPGVIHGIQYNHNDRVDDLNDRIFSRMYADSPLRPHFRPTPVMTRQSIFPIVDRRTESHVPISDYLDYKVGQAPISAPAPFEGYQNNVGLESDLRNQFYSLSSAPQRYYVPSSSSDLYNVPSVSGSLNEPQPFPSLFDSSIGSIRINPNIVNRPDIGSERFFNSTRAQLRGPGDFVR